MKVIQTSITERDGIIATVHITEEDDGTRSCRVWTEFTNLDLAIKKTSQQNASAESTT